MPAEPVEVMLAELVEALALRQAQGTEQSLSENSKYKPFDKLREQKATAQGAKSNRSGSRTEQLREQKVPAPGVVFDHSHSMVAGGLLVMSTVTRLIWRTSLVMRVDIFSSTS